MTSIEDAKEIATMAHKGQKRKNGEPYINHPMRVANAVESDNAKILAWLHDVLEDTKVTTDRLIAHGAPMSLVAQLLHLTRKRGQTYYDYIQDLCDNGIYDALIVKLADLEDNLRDLEECSLKDKYRFAKRMVEETLEPEREDED